MLKIASVCCKCGKPSTHHYHSKPYCDSCYSVLKESIKTKNAAMSVAAFDPTYKALTDYICQLFSIPSLSPLLQKQIHDYNMQGINNDDIRNALRFFYEMEGNSIEREDSDGSIGSVTIGIVPFIIDRSKAFWKFVDEANTSNQDVKINNQDVLIHIKPKCREIDSSYHMEDL